MMSIKLRPEQLEVSTGATDNNTVTTKGYTDDAVADALGGINFDYFFSDTAEGVIANYNLMYPSDTGQVESTVAAAIPAADTLIKTFITETSEPTFTTLVEGVYNIHIHAAKTAGTKDAVIYFEFYKRASGGTETLLATTENSEILTGSSLGYSLHFTLSPDEILLITDRIVVKAYGTPSGVGTDPTVTLYLEGTNASRVTVRTTSDALDNRYLVKSGLPGGQDITDTIRITGALNIDNINLNGQQISTVGNDLDLDPNLGDVVVSGSTRIDQSTFTAESGAGASFDFHPEGSDVSPEGTFAVTHGASPWSGATYNTDASGIIIDSSGQAQMVFLTPDAGQGGMVWGDASDNDVASFQYFHNTDIASLRVNNSATSSQRWFPNGEVIKERQPCFRAYRSTQVVNVIGGSTTYYPIFNVENFDIGGIYNNATGIMTASATARYFLSFGIRVSGIANTNTDAYCYILTSNNGGLQHRRNWWGVKGVGNVLTAGGAGFFDMDLGDTARVAVLSIGAATIDLDGASLETWFAGTLVH
jgi:hypothetical protein